MRRNRGQAALALNIVLTIFVVGTLGMVTYEISRILLAREQLRNCLEMASLAGGAAMASSNATGSAAQNESKTVAMNLLQMNSVLGSSLHGNVTIGSSATALNPTPGKTEVYFEFVDPVTKQPVASGQQANVLRVHGAYAYPLFAGGFGAIGVSTYTFTAQAMSGMPALDLVILDNTSGSMDDQTPVTLIRRHWDQSSNDRIIYTQPGAGPDPGNQGTIAGMFCPPLTGSQVNALPPQNLEAGGDPKTSNCPKEFSEVGPSGSTKPLRGITQDSVPGDAPPSIPPQGGVGAANLTPGPGYGGEGPIGNVALLRPNKAMPQFKKPAIKDFDKFFISPAYAHFTADGRINYEATNTFSPDPTLFTDLVVNLDGNTDFMSYTDPDFPAYPFDDLDTLVEAARGNMENGSVAPDAWISWNLQGIAQPGYKEAYELIAYKRLEPKRSLENSLINFMTKVSQTSDCHFSFIAFADRAGASDTDVEVAPAVSWGYPVAGKVKVALPRICLAQATNNYQTIKDVLTPPTTLGAGGPRTLMKPNGGCNLAQGLQQALADLQGTGSRPGAMKAIVVVTDKVPTRDLANNKYSSPTSNGQAFNDAMTFADQCNSLGIPIFIVALDQQNGQMTPYLQAQYSDTSTTGIVKTAGHGGALYINNWTNPTNTRSSLDTSFNNVVRQLTSLVQG